MASKAKSPAKWIPAPPTAPLRVVGLEAWLPSAGSSLYGDTIPSGQWTRAVPSNGPNPFLGGGPRVLPDGAEDTDTVKEFAPVDQKPSFMGENTTPRPQGISEEDAQIVVEALWFDLADAVYGMKPLIEGQAGLPTFRTSGDLLRFWQKLLPLDRALKAVMAGTKLFLGAAREEDEYVKEHGQTTRQRDNWHTRRGENAARAYDDIMHDYLSKGDDSDYYSPDAVLKRQEETGA